jgi:hypothetical protein
VAEIRARESRIEERAIELAAFRLSLTKEVILRELMRVGLAGIGDVCEFNAAGVAVHPSCQMSEDALNAIAEVRYCADGSVRVRMHDKLGALEKLGRHLGLFRHEVAMSGNIEHGVRDDPRSANDILLARVQAMLARDEAHDDLDQPDGQVDRAPSASCPGGSAALGEVTAN